jgi:hypothetical protein
MENCKALSLGIEVYTTSNPRFKGIARVCLVDIEGNRVLDTFVAPIPLQDDESILIKDQQKLALLCYATYHGPTFAQVLSVVKQLIKNRHLVAYHLPLKLGDLGIDHSSCIEISSSIRQIIASKFNDPNKGKK